MSAFELQHGDYSAQHVGLYGAGPGIRRRADGGYFVLGQFSGGDLAYTSHGLGYYESGIVDAFLGAYYGNELGDFVAAHNTKLSKSPSDLIEDSAGNVIFAVEDLTSGRSFWKIDTVSRRVSRFLGTGTEGMGEDYVPRLEAQLMDESEMDLGPDGDLWYTEYYGHRVRRVRQAGVGQRSELSLAKVSGDAQTLWPGELTDGLFCRVTDDQGANVAEIRLNHTPATGWEPLFSKDATNIDGLGLLTGRVDLEVGEFTMKTQVLTIDREEVDSVLWSYEVVEPPPGSVTTMLNVLDASSNIRVRDGSPALTAPSGAVHALAPDSTGGVYYLAGSFLNYISSDGFVSHVAGTTSGALSGNYGPAAEAALGGARDFVLDEAEDRIFLATSGSAGRIRVVDFSSGLIYPLTGEGDETADGRSVSDSAPWDIDSIERGPRGLYVSRATGIDIIDPDAVDPTIDSWMERGDCATDAIALYSCAGSLDGCELAFREDDKAYLMAQFCGADLSGTQIGVVLVSESGQIEDWILGGGELFAANPILGELTNVYYPRGLALDESGNLYFASYYRHTLRRWNVSTGAVEVVAGPVDSTNGYVDYVPGPQARFHSPNDVAVLTDGRVLVAEASNYGIRIFWP